MTNATIGGRISHARADEAAQDGNDRLQEDWTVTLKVCNWPMLLKNSIRVFCVGILGVSNHHLINLRGSERVLEGRLFRRLSMQPLQGSFSTA